MTYKYHVQRYSRIFLEPCSWLLRMTCLEPSIFPDEYLGLSYKISSENPMDDIVLQGDEAWVGYEVVSTKAVCCPHDARAVGDPSDTYLVLEGICCRFFCQVGK